MFDYRVNPKKAALYEKRVQHIMTMSEQEALSFVPDKPVVAYCECPNCYGGVEGNRVFAWSASRPDQMKCRFCGMVFPNPKFPETRVLSGKNKQGETISFRYYLNEKTKVRHFLSGNLRRWRREWIVNQLLALGRAYQATRKEAYARRAALLLDRFAQVYPHYPAMVNGPRRFYFCKSQDPPFRWDAGRWGHFHNEIPRRLVQTYDMVYDSPQFAALSKERGYDVRARLENDFFRKTFDAVSVTPYIVSNVVGYDITSAAVLGRVIGEPRYVHWAFRSMKRNVTEGFFFDGFWHESPSYHYMTIGGLRSAFQTVRGYSDPPGYKDAVDGTRFDHLDPEALLPFWKKCQRAPSILDFPNGCSTPVHDTWPNQRRSKPRNRTVSTIAPGFGHASLGRGEGPNQMQAQLHFSGGYGHGHYDNLNLTLWAKGREILSDIGYTWTQMRYWTRCSLGHNLVVVDRRDQRYRRSDGDLLWFFPDAAGVSAVEADGRRAYAHIKGLDGYRRLLVMIPMSAADAYVVDIFRVRGGSIHDWTAHGDADRDTTAACSLPLPARRANLLEPGEKWKEPTIEGHRFNPYGMVRDLRGGDARGPFTATFSYPEKPPRGLRIHLLPGGPARVWLGRSPSVRRMGFGTRGDMRKAYDFWMPQLVVRRRGAAPLASVFAAVHEPFRGKRFIDSVERLALQPPDENAVALRVVRGRTTDTIISTLDQPPYPERVAADSVALRGRLGVVRRVEGRVVAAWLFEGERVRAGSWELTSRVSRYAGAVLAAERKADGAPRDAFIVDAKLPLGDALRGAWMIVTHGDGHTHGYEIDRVAEENGRTAVVLVNDHGLRIEGDRTTEVFFPRRSIRGRNTFVIPVAAAVRER